MKTEIPVTTHLDFAEIKMYKNYLISTINEGIVFDINHLKKLHEFFIKFFPNTPYLYISDRKFDYSVDPLTYTKAKNVCPTLVGVAVACYSEKTYRSVEYERRFFNLPMEAFYSLKECEEWSIKIINKKAGL